MLPALRTGVFRNGMQGLYLRADESSCLDQKPEEFRRQRVQMGRVVIEVATSHYQISGVGRLENQQSAGLQRAHSLVEQRDDLTGG